jgi:hypothetical protein
MFAPTACTTPTRLPTLWWTLAATLLLLSVFAPAFASETHVHADAPPEPTFETDRLDVGAWRLVPLDRMVHAALLRRADATRSPMLPLAVLPTQRSALWFGLSANRTTGARIEVRWTMPLDGGAPNLRGLYE